MSEPKGEYKFTPEDADAIANAMAYQPDGVLSLRSLRAMVRTLTTQLHKEKAARLDSETALRDEIAALCSELETQKRMIAQLLRERATA